MMRLRHFVKGLLLFVIGLPMVNAQLADGSIAPPWTLTDLNGEVHDLYTYLDAGKTVVIDFSATWCGPCWSYHNGGVLETLWEQYGPDGTDEIMVFFLEGDMDTNDACLYGDTQNCSDFTQGDWVTGTGYPIVNIPISQASVVSDYQIGYWPTLYVVCADNYKTYEVGQASVSGWENYIFGSCPMDASYISEDALCFESGMIDLTTEYGYGSLDFDWSNGSHSEDLVNVGPGTYSVTITDANNHSINIQGIQLGGTDVPLLAELDDMQINDCYGDANGSLSVDAVNGTPPFTYSWSNGESGATINGLPGGTYDVTITDANLCEGTNSFFLEDPEELDVFVDVIKATCGFENGEIHLNGMGGTGFNYQYDVGYGYYPNQHYYDLPPGDYDISVMDENGCVFNTFATIEGGEMPVADAGADQQIDCISPEIELDGSNSTSGPNIDYYWSTSDGNIVAGGNTPNPIVDAPGTYNLLVYDYVDDCEQYDEVVVTSVIEDPVVDIAAPGLITCLVPSIVIDASGSDQGGDFIFDWNTTDGNILAGENTLTPTVDQAGTYTLTITNLLNGCSSSMDVTVDSDIDNPVLEVAAPDMITCDATEVVIDASGSEEGENFVVAWTTEDGTILEGAGTLTPTVNAAGTYTLSVTNTTTGCVATEEVVVDADLTEPSFTVQGAELSCAVPEVEVCITAVDNVENVVWADGAEGLCHSFTTAGVFTFTAHGVNGCTLGGEVEVTLDANTPVASAGDDQLLTCNVSTVTLDGSGSSAGDEYTYQWLDESGNVLGEEAMLDVTVPGIYTLVVTNTTNGCVITDEVIVDEFINIADPAFTSTLNYNILDLNSISNQPDDQSEWTSSDGQTADGFEAQFIYLQSGNYEICHTLTNECGPETTCEMISVTILPLTFDEHVLHISCPGGQDGSISVEATGGIEDYNIAWNGPDGFTSTSFALTNLSAGTYNMQLSDAAGTIIEESFVVEQPGAFEASYDVTDEIDGNADGAIDITITGGTPPYAYSWSNGMETEDLEGLTAGDYELVVTDANGCTFTVTITVDMRTNSFELMMLESFTIHPNPAFEQINVQMTFNSAPEGILVLLNNLGQRIETWELRGLVQKESINLADLKAGVYFFCLEMPEGTIVKKVVKL